MRRLIISVTREVKFRANKSIQMTRERHGIRRAKRETHRGFWCETRKQETAKSPRCP